MKTFTSKLSLSIKVPITNAFDEIVKSSSKNYNTKSDCQHIINDIYVSGYQHGIDHEFLSKNKFTHIINCVSSSKKFRTAIYEDFTYLLLDLKDEPGVDIIFSIYSVIHFIENSNKIQGRKILIHCNEGISRGPTLLTAYLMWKFNNDKEAVLNLVKEKRPCVDLNLGFMYQLDKWNENRKNKFSSDKIIKFELHGNMSIVDKDSLKSDEMSRISHILFKQNNILFNIKMNKDDGVFKKVQRFIYFLQSYENFDNLVRVVDIENIDGSVI